MPHLPYRLGRIVMTHLPGRRYTRPRGLLVLCPPWRHETFVLGLPRRREAFVLGVSRRRRAFVPRLSRRRETLVLRGMPGACGLVGFGTPFLPGRSGVIGRATRVLLGGGLVSRSASRPTIRRLPVSRILLGRAPVRRPGMVRLSVGVTLGSRRVVFRWLVRRSLVGRLVCTAISSAAWVVRGLALRGVVSCRL